MMNKKAQKKQKKRYPKNAFYFFMMEYNEKYLEGKMNKDLTKLQSMVSDRWQVKWCTFYVILYSCL